MGTKSRGDKNDEGDKRQEEWKVEMRRGKQGIKGKIN